MTGRANGWDGQVSAAEWRFRLRTGEEAGNDEAQGDRMAVRVVHVPVHFSPALRCELVQPPRSVNAFEGVLATVDEEPIAAEQEIAHGG